MTLGWFVFSTQCVVEGPTKLKPSISVGGCKQRAKYAAFLSEDPENLGISVREES